MIRIDGLQFRYPAGAFRLSVPQWEVAQGEAVAVTGPSGSGKTTLLGVLAGLLAPGAGRVEVLGTDLSTCDETRRRRFRLQRVGLVFQEFELLEYLDVLDNVLLPFRLGSELRLDPAVRQRAEELVEKVGLGALRHTRPERLSQGERQRVAVCRAMITRPKLLLADEPTGNLDPANKLLMLDLLRTLAREEQTTLVAVTHDHEILDRFDQSVDFRELTHESASLAGPEATP